MPSIVKLENQIAKLRAEHKERYEQAELLLDKEGLSKEDETKASVMVKECKDLQERIGNLKALIELGEEIAEQQEWAEEPAPSKSATDRNQFAVVGGSRAGSTLIEYGIGRAENEAKRILWDRGRGTIGEAKWNHIADEKYERVFWKHARFGKDALDPKERKDFQLGLDEQGGSLAPAEFINRVVGRAAAPTQLESRCYRLNTGRQKIELPRTQYAADDIYSTGIRVTKTGENPSSSTVARIADANMFGTSEVQVHTFMATAVITNDMSEDGAFDLAAWLGDKFSETRALHRENMILNGTGAGEPRGMMLGAVYAQTDANLPETVLSGAAGALAYDGFINLMAELPPQYEANAVFVSNKVSGFSAISKLKDGSNRPIFGFTNSPDPGLSGRRMMDILGYPYLLSVFMPNVGSAAFPFLHGDLRGYYLVDRVGLSVQVLREVGAEQNQIRVVARFRYGGALLEPFRVKLLKSNDS